LPLRDRLRRPRATIRGRLTRLYGLVFLVSAGALLLLTYGGTSSSSVSVSAVPVASPPRPFGGPAAAVVNEVAHQRNSDLHGLLIVSILALAIMAVVSVALGWLLAGRVLRPLRTMTAATRQISAENLHERLALDGPRDELRDLGDTIDGLLERLEGAFDAQRRFVANASHELRTPLTVGRALLEMVLSDPDATIETYRTICQQVVEAGEEQEQLIDALLMLARSQRGLDHRETVDLALVTGQVLHSQQPAAAARGLRLDASLTAAPLSGDPRLVERLVSNLVENAIRHNVPGGHAQIRVESRDGHATLTVINTGPIVPKEQIERLLQPFQRIAPERVGRPDGLGLGLSIVAAIATVHEAALDIQPVASGGLEVNVRFAPGPGGAAGS
jgi:signal transduction histidine kinase